MIPRQDFKREPSEKLVENARKDRVQNWRRYIPDELLAIWDTLSDDAQWAAYVVADYSADQEEWD